MPKILHLITGLETGGAERMLARLVACADRDRVPSEVVSMTGPGAIGATIVAAGVRLHSLGLSRGRPDPRAILRLARIIRAFRPDILQTWLYHADLFGLVARLGGLVPHLAWNLRCSDMAGNTAVRRLLARASGWPDAIIVNSAAGQRFHQGLGYRPRRWVLLPNGFDTAALRPDPEARCRGRAELGIASQQLAILLPARVDAMKDHATFLTAAAILAPARPDIVFVLAGAGTGLDNRALSEAIVVHGLAARVIRLGERRDLDRLYPAFDMVTLSSAYGEGFPNVLGEAMASGVPCVATDIGDCAAIIGEAGSVVPPRDPPALAAAWRQVLSLAPEERRALGTRARTHIVGEYGLDRIVARYEALYADIAGGRGEP